MGNDEAPQDFRELLNNAVVRERFEGYMNGIVHKDLISLVQGHGEIFRAKDASTSTIVGHSSTKDSDTIQCEEEDTAESTHMCQILQDQWLVKTIYTGFWVLLLDKAEGTVIARRFSSK